MLTIIYYMRDSRRNRSDANFHYHGHWQLELILEGETFLKGEDQQLRLGSGDFILIPPFYPHRFVYEGICHFYSVKMECKGKAFKNQAYYEKTTDTEILLDTLFRLFKSRDTLPQSDYKICAPVIDAFINSVLPDDFINDTVIEQAVRFIDANILQYITISDLCEHIPCSASSLNTKFQDMFGLTPKQYIDRARMALAVSYIRHSKFNIGQVAEKMNFVDVYTFHRFCRRNTGMTPGEIKKTSNSVEYKEMNFSESKKNKVRRPDKQSRKQAD
eukprot:TRINITY_DN4986_c0_g1_i2.p1 TRINITY_DN4986_c0_g1~~TRINITY_DN4986_c0_g1_i2.p1  ORF type:complete len:273 (-),score=51.55 TRINITY_DN4986_c0_g1_i2:529-1347(-)